MMNLPPKNWHLHGYRFGSRFETHRTLPLYPLQRPTPDRDRTEELNNTSPNVFITRTSYILSKSDVFIITQIVYKITLLLSWIPWTFLFRLCLCPEVTTHLKGYVQRPVIATFPNALGCHGVCHIFDHGHADQAKCHSNPPTQNVPETHPCSKVPSSTVDMDSFPKDGFVHARTSEGSSRLLPPGVPRRRDSDSKDLETTHLRVPNMTCSTGFTALVSMMLFSRTHALPVDAPKPSRLAKAMEQELVELLKVAFEATPLVMLYLVVYFRMQRVRTEAHLRVFRVASLIGSLLPSIIADARSSLPLNYFATFVCGHLLYLYAQAWSRAFYRSPFKLGTVFVGAFLLDLMLCHLSVPNQGVASSLFWQLLAVCIWSVLWTMDVVTSFRDALKRALQWVIELLG